MSKTRLRSSAHPMHHGRAWLVSVSRAAAAAASVAYFSTLAPCGTTSARDLAFEARHSENGLGELLRTCLRWAEAV